MHMAPTLRQFRVFSENKIVCGYSHWLSVSENRIVLYSGNRIGHGLSRAVGSSSSSRFQPQIRYIWLLFRKTLAQAESSFQLRLIITGDSVAWPSDGWLRWERISLHTRKDFSTHKISRRISFPKDFPTNRYMVVKMFLKLWGKEALKRVEVNLQLTLSEVGIWNLWREKGCGISNLKHKKRERIWNMESEL